MIGSQPQKILVVEDENPLLMALTTKLVSEGFGVLQARNGKEGLEVAEKELPDLILLDIVMPVMDGQEMFHKLKQTGWGRSIPVIFLTNVTDKEKWINVLGGYDYMVKSSWSLDDVIVAVKKKLRIEPQPISPPKR